MKEEPGLFARLSSVVVAIFSIADLEIHVRKQVELDIHGTVGVYKSAAGPIPVRLAANFPDDKSVFLFV